MSNTIGIYIHIPFCRSKCPYCDFFSMRGNINEYKKYVEILKDKIIYWSKKINKTVNTVYIGGGTPSVLGDELIFEIIKCIKGNYSVTDNAEITIEVNPSSGKYMDFSSLNRIGLNRVSLGLQSANNNELKQLGRIHSLDDVKNTVNLIKGAGINNISLDIMLGVP
ncbi:MAG: radical SAM protein, partial [Ruminococcus sp.]|nr:radical SAM protein [Ruminococcus sp.]